MKKTFYFSIFSILLIFLLSGCKNSSQTSVEPADLYATETPDPIYVISEKPTDVPTVTPTAIPTPTATPTPSTTPTPTPTPSPTPKGLIGGKYDVFSYEEEPVRDETQYKSEKVSITVTKYTENPYHNSKLVYFVADIYVQNLTALRTQAARSFSRGTTASINKISSSADAIIAINGDYYSHVKGLLIRNGEVYRTNSIKDRDICILYKDGTMETMLYNKFDTKGDLSNIWQAWQFGPYLIEADGTARKSFYGYGINPVNPRTVLGYYEPGHYCFVVVEGRRTKSYSAGLTLKDLARLMVDLGCTKAYNMDGGNSSQLYWNDEVFNRPSGDTLRVIPDIILIGEPYSDEESDSLLCTPTPEPQDNEESEVENESEDFIISNDITDDQLIGPSDITDSDIDVPVESGEDL